MGNSLSSSHFSVIQAWHLSRATFNVKSRNKKKAQLLHFYETLSCGFEPHPKESEMTNDGKKVDFHQTNGTLLPRGLEMHTLLMRSALSSIQPPWPGLKSVISFQLKSSESNCYVFPQFLMTIHWEIDLDEYTDFDECSGWMDGFALWFMSSLEPSLMLMPC